MAPASGLDADLLDGQQAAAFALTAHNHDAAYVNDNAGEVGTPDVPAGGLSPDRIAGTAWTSTNDGHLSGLDADLLDGQNASAFAGSGHNHDAAYWKLGGNSGTAPGAHFLGTTDNQALELKVNGQRVMRLEPATWGALAGNAGATSLPGAIAPRKKRCRCCLPNRLLWPQHHRRSQWQQCGGGWHYRPDRRGRRL